MNVLRCKCCGGTVVPKDNGIGECDSCGRLQTIPNTNDEKKLALIDRANHFRMNNEFDKALEIYEKVIEEDSTDSSVYYNISLCRYGIVYVDDPLTKKKMPTIYRFQADNKKDGLKINKFTDDADFKMAIKYAKSEQIELYNEEGLYIDKLLSEIMDIVKTEKPYDIFICYKETDENGNRTEDSVLAYDIFNTLTKEGFRVFFARITLKELPGIKYEPYIYSALITSKVMIVVGTKPEYLNAVWVKNEWSRFINLINNGADKTLIPAYKNITPYDFPNEFAGNQGINISDIAFKQDLLEGIKKIIGVAKNSEGSSDSDYKSALVNKEVESALKRAKSFIEEKNWEKADEYCEKALDIDAENGEVYLYKLLIEAKCQRIEGLKGYRGDISELSNYSKVLKYCNEEIVKKLKEINNAIKNDINDEKNFSLGSKFFNKYEYKDVFIKYINKYNIKNKDELIKDINEHGYGNVIKEGINTTDIKFKEIFENLIDSIRVEQQYANRYFDGIIDKNKYKERIEKENEKYSKLIEDLYKEDKKIRNNQITELENDIGSMKFNIKAVILACVISLLLIYILYYPLLLFRFHFGLLFGGFCVLTYFLYSLLNIFNRSIKIKKINQLYDGNADFEKKTAMNQIEREYNKKIMNSYKKVLIAILIFVIIFLGIKFVKSIVGKVTSNVSNYTSDKSDKNQNKEYYKRGMQLYKSNDFDKAYDNFKRIDISYLTNKEKDNVFKFFTDYAEKAENIQLGQGAKYYRDSLQIKNFSLFDDRLKEMCYQSAINEFHYSVLENCYKNPSLFDQLKGYKDSDNYYNKSVQICNTYDDIKDIFKKYNVNVSYYPYTLNMDKIDINSLIDHINVILDLNDNIIKSPLANYMGYLSAYHNFNDRLGNTLQRSFNKEKFFEDIKESSIVSNYDIDYDYEKFDCVTFGSYIIPATQRTFPIQWLVLSKDDEKALLVSKYKTYSLEYDTRNTDLNYYSSNIRFWLNNAFERLSFNNDERSVILRNTNDDDSIFLLDYDGIKMYMGEHVAIKENGLFSDYWLKTNETVNYNEIPYIDNDKLQYSNASSLQYVRPAIWVKLK